MLQLDRKKGYSLRQGLLRVGKWQRRTCLSCVAVYFGTCDNALGVVTAFRCRLDKFQREPEIDRYLKDESSGGEIDNRTGWRGLIQVYFPLRFHFDVFRTKPA
jgi:hypothetical protein